MKRHIFIIILAIITITTFYISYSTIKESIDESSIPDNNVIVIDSNKTLRDFLGKMRFICNLDENSIYNNIKPSICYKINRLQFYFSQVKDFLDNKTEEEIMSTYGYVDDRMEIPTTGEKAGMPPPIPIIGSNADHNILIKLSVYMKILKPYSDRLIWQQNDSANPPSVTSACSYNTPEYIALVKSAKKILENIKTLLNHFQYQIDNSKTIAYGDGADTGTGNLPSK